MRSGGSLYSRHTVEEEKSLAREVFEQVTGSAFTRRKVVTTGSKLAYAAPLVAASFSLSGRLAGAAADCSCIDSDRSPKPGGVPGHGCGSCVGGDPTGCYVCKGTTDATDLCGHETGSNIGVYDILPMITTDEPVCACLNRNGCWVKVNGQKIDLAPGQINTYCNGGEPDFIVCGGIGGPSPVV
jgi:hypothetical protein